MKIFGDDGFRSTFGEKYMTLEFLLAFAGSVALYCRKKKTGAPVLIGRDTRDTGPVIENILTAVLSFGGVDTRCAGIIPTPALSSLLGMHAYSLGIMITASHDPANQNGIKLFNPAGIKMDEASEKLLGEEILRLLEVPKYPYPGKVGQCQRAETDGLAYALKIRDFFPKLKLSSRLLVDCSNGAYSQVAKAALSGYKTVKFTHDQPDGSNINLQCGALEPENLLRQVREHGFDYGVAFDGDGDRVIFVSRDFGIIETEKLIVLFARLLHKKKGKGVVVSTEICNKGLEKNCENLGFDLIQTKVGDRNVVNQTMKNEGVIGAEPSGHYFFPQCSRTMDGLLALFHFLGLLEIHGDRLAGELEALTHFKRVKKDFPIDDHAADVIDSLYRQTNPLIDPANEKLVIRRSMWDPVVRVYYDYEKKNNFAKIDHLLGKELC